MRTESGRRADVARHAKDYARLSATPEQFDAFASAVGARIRVPVTIVHSVHDEFIEREHAEYLARSVPAAELVVLEEVSHFTPLQRPEQFNDAMLAFLRKSVL